MAESAQTRVNQLVFECLQKAAGIVLHARVSLRNHLQDRSWFPVSAESVDFVRQYLEPWATNLHEPLQLDIIDEDGALVERWTMHYSPKAEAVRERASTISRKIAILLRTLHSYVRILPAFQGPKKLGRVNYQFRIYNPSLKLEYTNQDFAHPEIGQYSFPLMKTPYGQLHIKSKYSLDPHGRSTDPPSGPAVEANIISDYIPDYHGPSRFTVADAAHRRTRSTSVSDKLPTFVSERSASVSESPSLVSNLPDPTDAMFSASPPFPQLDCTLLSTSPQVPVGLSGRTMTKFLQATVGSQHRPPSQPKQGMLSQAALNASNSRRRTFSDPPPALGFSIPALPDDPFDTPQNENFLEQKDDDPTGQLPFALEEFEPEEEEEQAGFVDDWGNAPFAQSITGSGLPGLFPLHRPQSFRKVSTTDCSVIEEQLQEFRSFKDSFYQAS